MQRVELAHISTGVLGLVIRLARRTLHSLEGKA